MSRKLKVQITGDAKRVRQTFGQISEEGGKLEKALGKIGSGLGKIVKAAGAALATAGVAAAAFGAYAVKQWANFDEAMVKSLAIQGDVSAQMRETMENAAREIGKTTAFSANEAAEAYFYLASAGLTAEQQVASLGTVASFATAGQFDLSRATDLLTDSQSALGMASEDTAEHLENLTRISDVFVGANTLANTSVEQLAEAFTSGAGVAARDFSMSVEESSAILAVFADQGVKGSEAGTKFRALLEGLSVQAQNNSAAFEELGIAVYDANGQIRPMADIVTDVTSSLGQMSDAERVAATQRMGLNVQSRAALGLLVGNEDALVSYTAELQSMGGITEEVAGRQLESLNGKLELIKGRLADVTLEVGKQLAPAFERVVDLFAARVLPALENGAQAIGPVIEAVGNFATGWGELLTGFDGTGERIDFVRERFGDLRTSISDAVSSVTDFRDAGTETLDSWERNLQSLTGVTSASSEAATGALDSWARGIEETSAENDALGQSFLELQGIKEGFGGAVDFAREKLEFLQERFQPVIDGAVLLKDDVLYLGESIVDATDGKLDRFLDVLVQITTSIVDDLLPALLPLIGTLITAAGAIGISTWELFFVVLEILADVLTVAVIPVLTTLADFLADNEGLVTALMLAFVGFRTVTTGLAAATGVLSFLGSLKTAILNIGPRAVETAGTVATSFRTIGEKIGEHAQSARASIGGLIARGKDLAVETAKNAATVVVAWFKKAVGAMKAAVIKAAAFVVAYWPWLLLIAVIGLIVYMIIKYWDQIKDAFIAAWEWIKEKTQPFINWLVGAFQGLVDWLQNAWDSIVEAATTAWDWVKENIIARVIEIHDWVVEKLTELWEWLQETWATIVETTQEAWSLFQEHIVEPVTAVVETILEWLEIAWEFIEETWANIKTATGEAWGWIRDNIIGPVIEFVETTIARVTDLWTTLTTIWETMRTVASVVWAALRTRVVEIATGLRDNVRDRIQALRERVTTIIERLRDSVRSIWEGLRDRIVGVVEGLRDRVIGAFNGIRTGIINAARTAVDRFRSIFTGITNAARRPINSVIRLINGFIGGVNRISFSVPDIPGIPFRGQSVGFSIPTIPTLHTGGVFRTNRSGVFEGLAMLRDGERVLTVDQQRQRSTITKEASSSDRQIHITVNARTDANPHEIGKEIAWAMRTSGGW